MLKFWQKSIVIASLCLMILVTATPKAQALIPTTEVASVPSTVKLILDRVWQWSQIAILNGWKNGINIFLSKWAKNEATKLAAGGRGQKPGFVQSGSQVFDETLDGAIGDTLNSLTKGVLGVDLCSLGDPQFAATLFVTFNQGTTPPKPSCTWQKIKAETYRFQKALDKKKNFSDWAKINLQVQYAASGAIGLEDDKAVDSRCKQLNEQACDQPQGTALKKDCYWYGNQCRSKLQARVQFCKYSDYDSSMLSTANDCSIDPQNLANLDSVGQKIANDLGNCKWSTAGTTGPGACIPDIGPLEAFGGQFSASGGLSDIEAAMRTNDQLVQKTAKSIFDAAANLNFSGMTRAKLGAVTADALTPREPSQAQSQMLQQGMLNNMLSDSGSAIVNAANIFISTFLQQKWQTLMQKGVTAASNISNATIGSNASGISPLKQAEATFATWEKPQLISSLQEHLEDQLINCSKNTEEGVTPYGSYNCTINAEFAAAMQSGLTLRQAADSLGIDVPFGFQADGNEFPIENSNPLSFRSLSILRSLEVIPVGWEIAALYGQKFGTHKPLTLRYLALGNPGSNQSSAYTKGCFEDLQYPDDPNFPAICREDTDGDNSITAADLNPYWHLVDPDWVLKLPPTKCALGGNGEETLSVTFECIEDNVPGTQLLENNAPTGQVITGSPACDSDSSKYLNPDLPVAVVTRKGDYCADRQDCIQTDGRGNCINYGYCYEQKPSWKFDGQSCSEQAASCQSLTRTSDNRTFNYLGNTLKSCDKPGCLWLATETDSSAAWKVGDRDNKIFLTLNGSAGTETCSSKSAGCTRLISQEAGINVVEDGDFSHVNWLDYWEQAAGANCSIDKGPSLAEGQIPAGLDIRSNQNCTLRTKGEVPIIPGGIYLARVFVQSATGGPETNVTINFKDADSNRNFKTLALNVAGNQVGQVTSSIEFLANDPAIDQIMLRPEIVINSGNATATIQSFELVKVDTQTSQFANNNYNADYSRSTDFDAYYKVAPDALACDQYYDIVPNSNTEASCLAGHHVWRVDWQACVSGGNVNCLNYLPICKAADVGCLGYTPLSGGPQVPAKVTAGNFCPQACVGFAFFQHKTTVFEKQETNGHPDISASTDTFIPKTAQACQPQAAGCEEFTNLDQLNAGGEGKEYFTSLRQCVLDNNPSVSYYYTWEGSDTAGFQLKRWQLLKSNQDTSPCSNITPGAVSCSDPANPGNPATNSNACTADDLRTNFNCRDFFDINNNHFYRLQNKTVSASANCHPYRRTISNQIYNAIPTEGVRCQAQENGCREYLGNQGQAIRKIVSEDFENPATVPANWGPEGLTISNIAVQPGGHSLLVDHEYLELRIPSSSLHSGRRYQMTAWAKLVAGSHVSGTGGQAVNFSFYDLTADWQLYQSNVEAINVAGDYTIIRLYAARIPAGQKFLLDNVVLQELPDNFYVKEGSWQTPAECSANYQGCQAYQESSGNQVTLTGFDRVCSAQSMGCKAFIDTKNSVVQSSVTKSQGDQVNDMVVPNDALRYLVPDDSKLCGKEDKACQALGLPQVDLNSSLAGTNVTTVYLKNDPDRYDQILCSKDQLFCSAFGSSAYFDPAPKNATSSSYKVCSWQNDTWKKADGSNCPGLNPSNDNYLLKGDQQDYDGWVAQCSNQDNLCTEYRDPEQPSNDQLPLCRSDIGKDTYGTCTLANGVPNNSWCTDGDGNTLCKAIGRTCQYGNLWYCVGNPNGSDPIGNDCYLNWYGQSGVSPCRYTNKVGNVDNGQRYCQFDVSCNSYYQKSDSITACSGLEVNRGQGCRLFNDTSPAGGPLIYNATSSRDGSSPVKAVGGLLPQANKLIQVTPDRQCSEWLYCKSSITVQKDGKDTQLCLGLGACKKFNASGECAEPVFHAVSAMSINLAAPLGSATSLPWSKVARFQTGYKYPQVIWSNVKQLAGNYLPDLMTQTAYGEITQLNNSGFETTNSTTLSINRDNRFLDTLRTDTDFWQYGQTDYAQCEFKRVLFDEVTGISPVLNSHYSLRIDLKSGTGQSQSCVIQSNTGTAKPPQSYSKTLPITGRTGYTVTFWAKGGQSNLPLNVYFNISNNGGQIARPYNSFILTTQWRQYIMSIPAEKIPVGAQYIAVDFMALIGATPGSWLYLDEVSLQPGLQVAKDNTQGNGALANKGEAFAAAQCRLYPKSDSLSCGYAKNGKMYEGVPGYCLEKDPANGLCLKWYPLTYVAGSRFSTLTDEQTIAYNDRAPLYYCLQSEGNSNYYQRPGASGGAQTPTPNDPAKFDVSTNDLSLNEFNVDYVKVESAGEASYITRLDGDIFRQMSCGDIRDSGYVGADNHDIMYQINCDGTNEDWIAYAKSHDNRHHDDWENLNCANEHINPVIVSMRFNATSKNLTVFKVRIGDCTGGNNEEVNVNEVDVVKKEKCLALAQVVNNQGENKVKLNIFNSGWSNDQGNALGVSKNMSGSIMSASPYGSFLTPQADSPEAWQVDSQPLVIYQGGSCSQQFAGFPLSTRNGLNGRSCISGLSNKIGQNCNTSADCGDNNTPGVCMGLGKLCYDSQNQAIMHTNGRTCTNNSDCSAAQDGYNVCGWSELPTATSTAVANLQGLFARIYGIWSWNGSSYVNKTGDYRNLDVSSNGTSPTIVNSTLSKSSVSVQGGSVNLTFATNVNADQKPIKSLQINWGDGQQDVLNWLNPKTNPPFSLNHSYTCLVAPNGRSCAACQGGIQAVNGRCVYPIRVNVTDNWDKNNGNTGESAGTVTVGP